ncbi:MAG: tRNA (adenosine(37)-N6)-threonylcarbamoyltransferase complex ATPase subunit type 1 TsaE [Legionellales bacterium]|nr:tRNA (adenosine(37)-N6)-threonylcarbamoyltransferase complex ATPase subunit type 1 TsaE [Legionellales bacterium]
MKSGELRFELKNLQVTERLAARLASRLIFPLVFTFSGDLGSGKTTFIRALLRHLGVDSVIKSPTFSLVESYEVEKGLIHHFDLYRIHDETELDDIGFRDYFGDNALCCIEWPERVAHHQQWADLAYTLGFHGDGREMRICALTVKGDALLSCFDVTL